jgi:hypothetical protein
LVVAKYDKEIANLAKQILGQRSLRLGEQDNRTVTRSKNASLTM